MSDVSGATSAPVLAPEISEQPPKESKDTGAPICVEDNPTDEPPATDSPKDPKPTSVTDKPATTGKTDKPADPVAAEAKAKQSTFTNNPKPSDKLAKVVQHSGQTSAKVDPEQAKVLAQTKSDESKAKAEAKEKAKVEAEAKAKQAKWEQGVKNFGLTMGAIGSVAHVLGSLGSIPMQILGAVNSRGDSGMDQIHKLTANSGMTLAQLQAKEGKTDPTTKTTA